MTRPSSNPRCKCCDEIMEELLTMRQTFEKLLHRLTNQIVDLRRELSEALENTNGSKEKILSGRKAARQRSPSPEPPSKKNNYSDDSESEMEIIQPVSFDNSSDNELMKSMKTNSSNADVLSTAHSDSKSNLQTDIGKNFEQPTFFKSKQRIMPKRPFTDSQQFEDWNDALVNDDDLRDQLRIELLKGSFDEPDKYIKHIWKSILKNQAADKYSFRGTGRCKKKAIKNYVFTEIFLECFLQRFHHMDDSFFIERTMRFFNYANNHMRKRDRERTRLEQLSCAS